MLFGILSDSDIADNQFSILRSIDKLDKIDQDGVTYELISKGPYDTHTSHLFNYIKTAKPDENLQNILDPLSSFSTYKTNYVYDSTLVRGCDYYTGTIFEVGITTPKINAIERGGPYDNLINTLGGPNNSAVGFSFDILKIIF